MIGLDTSHVTAFTKLLNDPANPYHVSLGRVVAAYKGGSPDMEQSASRVDRFTEELARDFGVEIVPSISDLRDRVDIVFLESVDGRTHLRDYREIVTWKKPVFIDKPLTVNSAEALEIAELSEKHGTPTISASAIRYAEVFTRALKESEGLGPIYGCDFYGPMAFVEKAPGYFWYGIHTADMLFAAFGSGCTRVNAYRTEQHDVVVGHWPDGRMVTMRGNRAGNHYFGGTIHREKGSVHFNTSTNEKPYYASLLEAIRTFVLEGRHTVPLRQSVEVIRFLEAANESATRGGETVCL